MPNPHFRMTVISRNGRHRSRAKAVASAAYNAGSKVAVTSAMKSSVVAAAAYRSGEALLDIQEAKTYDYSHKDEVVYTAIMVPHDAPPWAGDRMLLWNGVENFEKRSDSQLARDLVAALPRELNTEQQISLVRDYVEEYFVAHGMVADIAIHDKETASDGGRQPHVHILLTMRPMLSDGFATKKNREWNKKSQLKAWRQGWADTTNKHLELAGREERLDLRSYEAQGIDKIPGKHMGSDAWNLEQQGVETDKGDLNREIDHTNQLYDVTLPYLQPEMPAGDSEVLGQGDMPVPDRLSQDGLVLDMAAHEERRDGDSQTGQKRKLLSESESRKMDAIQPRSEEQMQALHMALIARSVQSMVHHSMRRTVEQLTRWRDHAAAAIEKARALVQLARDAFDRYAVRSMQRPRPNRDMDGPER